MSTKLLRLVMGRDALTAEDREATYYLRVTLVVALARFATKRFFSATRPRSLYAAWLVAWTAFYSLYFSLMPG